MNNKRAIELLHRLQDEQFDGIHGDERREALSMAVRALEQNLVHESGGLVQDLVKDCISRQAAIEFVDYLLSQPCKGHTGDFVEGMRDGYYRIRSAIKYLPSAQPETHDKRTETHACDLINRQQAIEAFEPEHHTDWYTPTIIKTLEELPQAQQDKSCKGCHFEKHGSRACDNCSRMYMDRYEVRNVD